MRKHFMCTHTFSSEEAWEKSSNPDTVLTDRQFFEKHNGDKARVLQHWRGSEDFFFCHWEAETEDDIHDLLEKTGMALNIVTMPQEMHRFVTTYDITDEKMIIPPRKL
jgi:hypothetical protein